MCHAECRGVRQWSISEDDLIRMRLASHHAKQLKNILLLPGSLLRQVRREIPHREYERAHAYACCSGR